MKSALLSKIAMCVCPPAIVATTAMTVPPVKRAVHRITAPHAIPAVSHARPRRAFTAAYDCVPTAVPLANAVPLTNQAVAPDNVAGAPDAAPSAFVAQTGGGGAAPGFQGVSFPGGGFGGGGGLFYPTVPVIGATPGDNAGPTDVPEASTWMMTIGGFGAIGWALRRRHVAMAKTAKPDPA